LNICNKKHERSLQLCTKKSKQEKKSFFFREKKSPSGAVLIFSANVALNIQKAENIHFHTLVCRQKKSETFFKNKGKRELAFLKKK